VRSDASIRKCICLSALIFELMIPLDRMPGPDLTAGLMGLVSYTGKTSDGDLQKVYRAYLGMKELGFFRSVMALHGNRELTRRAEQRTFDIFGYDGKFFVIVECSGEALEAFLDDGRVLLKSRDAIKSGISSVLSAQHDDLKELWDAAVHSHGSPIPQNVRAIPLFNEGMLAVILVKAVACKDA
jgi:hypothetical protein